MRQGSGASGNIASEQIDKFIDWLYKDAMATLDGIKLESVCTKPSSLIEMNHQKKTTVKPALPPKPPNNKRVNKKPSITQIEESKPRRSDRLASSKSNKNNDDSESVSKQSTSTLLKKTSKLFKSQSTKSKPTTAIYPDVDSLSSLSSGITISSNSSGTSNKENIPETKIPKTIQRTGSKLKFWRDSKQSERSISGGNSQVGPSVDRISFATCRNLWERRTHA